MGGNQYAELFRPQSPIHIGLGGVSPGPEWGMPEAYVAALLAQINADIAAKEARERSVMVEMDRQFRGVYKGCQPVSSLFYEPKEKTEKKPRKKIDWTLPLSEPWASRFAKVYFTMLALTPVYLALALLGF